MRDERGMALVLVLLCATLFLALGAALVTIATTETSIAATFREGAAALAGAETAIARALSDVAVAPDLNALLAGTAVSAFSDGPPAHPRRLPDGTLLDLVSATDRERCGASTCSEDDLSAVTADRPWGVNNARWQLYASGWLGQLVSVPADVPHVYVVVWIGDDPLETDGDPLADAGDTAAPGHDVVVLRAMAFAAYSVRRRIEVVARRADGRAWITSWRELR